MVAGHQSRAVRAALLRYPTPDGRRWLRFDDPEESITAWTLDQVVPALDRAQVAADDGSWVVGLVAYDAAPAFESRIRVVRDLTVPLVAFGVFPAAAPSRGPAGDRYKLGEWTASRTRDAYLADLERVHELIAAGETYQLNYTMRLTADFDGDPLGLFSALSRAQRAEHMAYVDLGDAAVCSASPELFLRRSSSVLSTRPMKGTRPRDPDPIIDSRLADELVRSAKDRAENTMIVDMVRNDLGRIAEVGSVAVPDLYSVEHYPTVHQMTSTVEAVSEVDLGSLFAATFPAASITGAPKVRTGGLIAELEATPRGVYTGAVGAIEPGGDLEFNVAIRTVWVDRVQASATYGIGGGIVWDSVGDAEWTEAIDKARILARCGEDFRLLETMLCEPGAGVVLLERHLDRLGATAEHFGFDVNLAEIRRLITAQRPDVASIFRLLVDADGAAEFEVVALPEAASTYRVAIDSEPVDRQDEFLFHKTTRRDRYDQARGRFADADDVLLYNTDGEVTETTIGNLVIDLDGKLVTPARQSGLLAGTFRTELLEAGKISEQVVHLDDLARSERIWMINSVRGWVQLELVGEPQRALR
ncbi:MAG: aminodeoxychorismate synthase component I [Acidobacteria bacterium]|nr:aminodeoxychorismate synthase component I [Acidobacteriota bacterium]